MINQLIHQFIYKLAEDFPFFLKVQNMNENVKNNKITNKSLAQIQIKHKLLV